MRQIGICLVFTLALSANARAQEFIVDDRPALPFRPGVTVESQCGAVDDLQDVESYDGTLGVTKAYVEKHEPTTVQLQWLSEAEISARLADHSPGNVGGARWCTGTLISDRLVLTAGHCFDEQRDKWGWLSPWKLDANGKAVYASPATIATLQQVHFGYQVNPETGNTRTPETYQVKQLLEHWGGKLDYAIIELSPKNDKYPMVAAATPLAKPPKKDAQLAVVQHPQGKPKKIEAGSVKGVSGTNVYYGNIDTHGGSSGSGVRDKDGKVIGVHTNGGCTADGGANRGVTTEAISAVSDHL